MQADEGAARAIVTGYLADWPGVRLDVTWVDDRGGYWLLHTGRPCGGPVGGNCSVGVRKADGFARLMPARMRHEEFAERLMNRPDTLPRLS